jgi:hypothetical protein
MRSRTSFVRQLLTVRVLIEWLGVKGKDQRQYWPWQPEYENWIRHAYFYYYTSSFAKPYLREAMAVIPGVFQVRTSRISLTID